MVLLLKWVVDMEQKIFLDLEAEFEKRNKLILTVSMIIILIQSTVIYIIYANKQVYLLSEEKFLTTSISKKALCRYAMQSIASKEYSISLLTKKIINELNKVKYSVHIINVLEVIAKDKYCKVLVEGAKGIRAFKLSIIENESFVFARKINDLNEYSLDEVIK